MLILPQSIDILVEFLIDKMTESFGDPKLRPLWGCLLYSILAVCVTDGARRLANIYYTKWSTNPEGFRLWNEFMSVILICTFVFQEAVICDHYGHLAMFFMILIHQALAEFKNKGGGVNSCLLVEEWSKERLPKSDLLWLGGIHYLAATIACRFSDVCWYNTKRFADLAVPHDTCLYKETVAMPISGLVQFMGSFICRGALSSLAAPPKRRKFIPLVYATLMTTSHYITGVSGIHPMQAASLLANCILVQNEAAMKYGLVYLGCLSAGWLLAALFATGDNPMRSIWREKFEREEAATEAARLAALPQFRWIGRGNNRRQVPIFRPEQQEQEQEPARHLEQQEEPARQEPPQRAQRGAAAQRAGPLRRGQQPRRGQQGQHQAQRQAQPLAQAQAQPLDQAQAQHQAEPLAQPVDQPPAQTQAQPQAQQAPAQRQAPQAPRGGPQRGKGRGGRGGGRRRR